MQAFFSQIFEKKKFYVLGLIVIGGMFFISSAIAPIYINNEAEKWEAILDVKTKEIQDKALQVFKEEENNLLDFVFRYKKSSNSARNISDLVRMTLTFELPDGSLQLYDEKGEIIIWSGKTAIGDKDIKQSIYNYGETFFYKENAVVYLRYIDTINFYGEKLTLIASKLIEKQYRFQSPSFREISLSKRLMDLFYTSVDIQYSQFAEPTKDGRKKSIEIINNKNRKIGSITFNKPTRDLHINAINNVFSNIQYFLIIVGFALVGLAVYSDARKIRNRWGRFIILSIYLIILRYLLYFTEIPIKYMPAELTDSAYFASAFGFGIVKSPFDLFITAFFFLIICIRFHSIAISYLSVDNNKDKKFSNAFVWGIFFLIASFIFLLALRGLGASIKSVVFDSSLKYFHGAGLLPNIALALMELNILFLGVCSAIFSISLILFIITSVPITIKVSHKTILAFIFVFFQLAGWAYDFWQREPQGFPALRIFFISACFAGAYYIYFKKYSFSFVFLYYSLLASLTSVALLNFYNLQLEKDSLKTVAYDLTRYDYGWHSYLVNETLNAISEDKDIALNFIDKKTNFDALAFSIWSGSPLQKEGSASSIMLFDNYKKNIGNFSIIPGLHRQVNSNFFRDEIKNISIFEDQADLRNEKIILSGAARLTLKDKTVGYAALNILFEPGSLDKNYLPDFMISKTGAGGDYIDLARLRIIDIYDNKVKRVYGDLIPSSEQLEAINKIKFDKEFDAWTSLKLGEENYIVYVLNIKMDDHNRHIAVCLREKALSLNMFNFIKIFFVHAAYILSFLIILFIVKYRRGIYLRLTFRAQLTMALLFISIMPLIILAVFYRNLTIEKNNESGLYKLKKRAVNVENYLTKKSKNLSPMNEALNEAAEDLNVNYTLFKNNELFYSSYIDYFNSGIFSKKINPDAALKFNYEGFNEAIFDEMVENYSYRAFYKKTIIHGIEYNLCVNDLFNSIKEPISGEELDVFMIGSYSFASILIIFFSVITANSISRPIRKLTQATHEVAKGNLDVKLPASGERGEISMLIEGFNSMVKELKKSQIEIASLERENAWKEFARQVAHEVKNPLTPMKLAIQHLIVAFKDKTSDFPIIFEKVTKTILSQIEILGNIASEFSAFARMPGFKVERLNIAIAIEDAMNLFLDQRMKFIFDNRDIKIFINADREQLKRAFINLFRNSIQAGAQQIMIEIVEINNFCSIRLIDNGAGMTEEQRGKAFIKSFTTKEKGMGIGLGMTKKIIENINGEISILNSSSSGTTMEIKIPVLKK